MEAARDSSSDEGPIIARPMQRIQGEGVSPRSSSSSSSSDSETEIVDLVLGQVLEERRLSVVEEVSSGGEDPNAPASDAAGAGVVRAKPILAMMHSLTSSSSSDGHETVVIAESTMPGIVHVANCTTEGGTGSDIEDLFISF